MRLFVAVNLPGGVRDDLSRAAAPLRETPFPVKWIEPDGVHLTLKFLGDVVEERVPAVVSGIEDACRGVMVFTLGMSGFGAFPSPQRPRVIWVGCEPVPALELLQHGMEREMQLLGFPLDGRPFQPHLTLGRVRRGAGALPGFAALLDALSFECEFLVESVDLMQSTLSRAGARYTRRHAVPLDAG